MVLSSIYRNRNINRSSRIIIGMNIFLDHSTVVDKYTYLGIKITHDLDEYKMMEARIVNEDGDDPG